MMGKYKVVCFLNQFFGQIGGEDMADVGVSYKETPIGPAILIDQELGEEADVIATIICGDNYFADDPDKATKECMEIIIKLKPDLFMAGPSFNAGRYGMNCGKIASEVTKTLNIPSITAMYPESPGAEIYRTKTFVIKTGIQSGEMKKYVEKMVHLGKKLVNNEKICGALAEGYLPRDILRNEKIGTPAAKRCVDMLLKKIKGEPFTTEMSLPTFKPVTPAPPVADLTKAKIAIISDGGLCPEANPDGLKSFASTSWGCYNIDKLLNEPHRVVHGGYDGSKVMDDPHRLIPIETLRQIHEEGKIGDISDEVYIAAGNCAAISAAENIGRDIVKDLKAKGISAAILTST